MLNSAWLQKKLTEGKEAGCFPAAAAAIGVKDHVLAKAFIGEAPEPGDQPVDEHTRWDMASLSKVIGTTMVALRAMEEGKLSLQERVKDFFPEAPADKADITVFQLMTHTGGFVPDFWLQDRLTDPADTAQCILDYPLAEKPGVRPIYSCMGYILLAKMLEKRLGAPLDELAGKMVFGPLGLDETGYCPPAEAVCAATEVDKATGKPWIGIVHDENARFQRGISGNAGIFMSLRDGIRFAGMLARGGEGLLRKETLAEAIRNYTPGMDQHRGLGFHLAGTPDCFFSDGVPSNCFGHTGFTGTSLIVEPESGFWVLLLANRVYPTRDNSALFPFRRRLHTESWTLFHTPMSGEEMAEALDLPGEIRERFAAWDREDNPFADDALTTRLLNRGTWTEAEKELEERIGEDPDHIRLLWEELRIVRKAWPAWLQKGLPESVWIDTMRFATRYLHDGKKAYGRFCFKAGWWFPRQMAMELFRLGSLEFELFPHAEGKRVYLHIPSDGSLAPADIDDSLERFRAFAAEFYPAWQDAPMYCDSWLLSPALREMLPEGSRILAFQERFRILSVNEESMSAIGWVFPGHQKPSDDLPEGTTLQKRMKAFLKKGGKPGWAEGKMK